MAAGSNWRGAGDQLRGKRQGSPVLGSHGESKGQTQGVVTGLARLGGRIDMGRWWGETQIAGLMTWVSLTEIATIGGGRGLRRQMMSPVLSRVNPG